MSARAIGLLFPFACFIAIGCSVFETQWEVVAPAMQPIWFQVSVAQLRAICGESALACVRRDFASRACYVFAIAPREEMPQFIVEHEELEHCREGKNHD